MKEIRDTVTLQLKCFLRMRILCIAFIGMIVLLIGLLSYLITSKVDTLFFMNYLGNYTYYICAAFTIISFMFLTNSKRNDLDETLKVMKAHYIVYSIIVLSLMAIVLSLIVFIMMIYIIYINQSFDQLFSLYIPSFCLNIVIPLYICIFVSLILSKIKNYTLSGVLLVLFIMLMSPMFYMNMKNGMGQIIYDFIMQPFHFLYPGDEFSMDYMYGLKDEPYRWLVALFYIVLMTGTILISYTNNKKKKWILVISTACLSVVCLLYSTAPRSTLNVIKSKNDLIRLEHGYEGNYYKTYQEVDYNLDNYKLNINIKEMLYVDGTFTLKSKIAQKEFSITLYSGYTIKELSSQQSFKYTRDADIIRIIFDQETSEADMKIVYSGYHPTFYSNNQAACLPAYFPWYPMSGEHQVQYVEKLGECGYNPLNKINKTDIQMNVQSDYPIISNLDETSEKQYSGYSDGITLMGGYIEEGNDLFVNVFPVRYSEEFGKEDNLKSLQTFYDQTLDDLQLYNIDPSILINKKIINQPKSMTYFSSTNDLAIFDDYIIAKDGIVSTERVISYYLWDKKAGSDIVNYLYSILHVNNIDRMKEEYEERYQFSEDNIEKRNRIVTLLSHMTSQEFIDEFFSYGYGQTQYQSDEEFLQAMEVKYDRD